MPRNVTPLLSPVIALLLAACASGAGSPGEEPGPENADTQAEQQGEPVRVDDIIVDEEPDYAALFTNAQAEDGESVYRRVCLECHTLGEFGDRPFLFAWEGSTVAQLYDYIEENMPDEAPGSLDEEDYQAVMAYILEMNGYPSGLVRYGERPSAAESVLFRRMGS